MTNLYSSYDDVIECHSDYEVNTWRSILNSENSGVDSYQVVKDNDEGFIAGYQIGVNYTK